MAKRYCPNCHEATASVVECEHCGADTVLNGEWVLHEFLGHGAAGYTWRASRGDSEEWVAIKELSFRRMTDLKQLELFEREVEALEALDHEGVPRYLGSFVVEDERFVSAYLVQEFIDGTTLEVGQDETEVRRWLLAMSDILESLHGRRPPVIHRDIKPSNVMRRADGSFVLIDFGSIREATQGSVGGSTVAGTLGYMAPEQLLGKAEPASDFYGLGATAVAMLAGRDASELIDPHEPGAWRKKVDVSDGLAGVLDQLLEPKASKRINSAKALRRALEQSLVKEPGLMERLATWRDERAKAKAMARAAADRKAKRADRSEDEDEAILDVLDVVAWFVFFGIGAAISIALFPAAVAVFVASLGWADVLSMLFSGLWLTIVGFFPVMLLYSLGLPFVARRPFMVGGFVHVAVLFVVAYLNFAPSEVRPNEHAVAMKGDEVRQALFLEVGPGDTCVLAVISAKTGGVLEARKVDRDSSGCPKIELTSTASAWVIETGSEPRARLFSVWDGSVLYDTDDVLEGSVRFGKFEGETVEVRFPDGSSRAIGPNRASADGVVEMKRIEPGGWVYSADLQSPEGFRKSTFTRDSGCGALTHYNTTDFGPGDWRVAQVDPSLPSWDRSVYELAHADELLELFVGPDVCWLVSNAGYFSLDPRTGESTRLDFTIIAGR